MDSDGLTLERVIGTTTRHGTSLSASRADGSLAFAAGRLVVLSPAGPRAPAAHLACPSAVTALCFSADGAYLAAGYRAVPGGGKPGLRVGGGGRRRRRGAAAAVRRARRARARRGGARLFAGGALFGERGPARGPRAARVGPGARGVRRRGSAEHARSAPRCCIFRHSLGPPDLHQAGRPARSRKGRLARAAYRSIPGRAG
jgi:hypothetical protein